MDDRRSSGDDEVLPQVLTGREVVSELLGDGLTRRLARWAADARIDDAARRRARRHWLGQQLTEEAAFAGLLVDLAERNVHATVELRSGGARRGRVVMVGGDFLALALGPRELALVALDAVSSVRTAPGEPVVAGDRAPTGGATLVEVLADLAAERPRLTLCAEGVAPIGGVLQSVGQDLCVVRQDGDDRPMVHYVRLSAITEVLLG